MAAPSTLSNPYLGCSFAANHNRTPILAANDRSDFPRRQVLTARNVRASWLVDGALGGLNYQIEHHLFPSMPPTAPRPATPPGVLPPHGLAYCETTLWRSYAQAIRQPPRRRPAAAGHRGGLTGGTHIQSPRSTKRTDAALEGSTR
jgi:hypothetical protein